MRRASWGVVVVAALAALAGPSAADVVHLRDGRTIRGEASWTADGAVLVIETVGGRLAFSRDEVVRIEESESPRAELRRRERALAEDDHAGRLELARFALERELEVRAARLLEEVAAAPDADLAAEAARLLEEALDYHPVDGEWLAPDDYYPARGWIEVDGRWVAPEDAPAEALHEAYAERVLDLLNAERREAGLRRLRRDRRAERAALAHAEDMAEREFFSHTCPDGTVPRDRAEEARARFERVGENIAAGQPTPEEVMRSWMASPGHRENILREEYTHVGVGLAWGRHQGRRALYWVQVFLGK